MKHLLPTQRHARLSTSGCNCDGGCLDGTKSRRRELSAALYTNETASVFLALLNKNNGCSLGLAEVKSFLLGKIGKIMAPTKYLASIGITKVNKKNVDKIAGELARLLSLFANEEPGQNGASCITVFVFQLADENNDGRLEPGEIDVSLQDFNC